MKNIIETIMEKDEIKSWQEEVNYYYVIVVPKTIKTEHGQKTEYLRMESIVQSREHPRGITKEDAIQFAGKNGKVWVKKIRTKRLK